ncbi:MAG: hypothetical protein KTU85_05760 [Acidimicrobiia bacterium]|nr:hypothetical protein [Acidimicrobiia bacterium]
MGSHIQGVAILILVVAALWGLARLAGPVLAEALGEQGAIIAKSPEETNEPLERDAALEASEAPLTVDEITNLQWLLAVEGYLNAKTDVDGLLGPVTEAAITEAKATLAIPTANHRVLLSLLEGRNAALLNESNTNATTTEPPQ